MQPKIQRIEAIHLSQAAKNPSEKILATREFGSIFYELLLERLAAVSEGQTTELSFNGVRVMDASFADEVFGRIVVHRVIEKGLLPPLYHSYLQDSHLDNIQYTLEARLNRQEGLRNCVVPMLQKSGDLTLIGKCEEGFQKTFDLLRAMRELTTRQVADTLKLSLQLSSTRLKALYDYGLAFRQEVRDEQGKQFVYRWII